MQKRGKYKPRQMEQKGITYKEPIMIKSFWSEHTIDQIQSMSDDELNETVDNFMNKFIDRQMKRNIFWNFPIESEYLRIAPYTEI